jgi:hypothetical protein
MKKINLFFYRTIKRISYGEDDTNVVQVFMCDYGYPDANKFGVVALVNRYRKTVRWYTKGYKARSSFALRVHDDGPKHFW